MKTKNTADTITAIYADYEKDVSAVLANLDRTTPTPIIRQLQNMKKADQTARNNPATAEAITEATEAHADHRESIENLDRITARITATEAERLSAYYEAGEHRTEAEEARHTAQDLEKVIARTLSDRADLVQVCAEADRLWRTNGMSAQTALIFHDGAWKRRHIKSAKESGQTMQALFNAFETLKSISKEKPQPTNRTPWAHLDAGASARVFVEAGYTPIFTTKDLDRIARQRYRRNAVSRYIRSQKSGTALDGCHTDKTPATPADVTAWTKAGKLTGSDNRYPTKAGNISLEYREATKTAPAGWYFVNRRYTINQWHSIEALTEAGDISGIIRTQNIYAENLEAVERIEAIMEHGTQREREWLKAFCSPSAVEAGEEARRAYTEAHTKQTANGYKYNGTPAGRSEAGWEARRAYAYKQIGMSNPNTASQFFRRMCQRLEVYKQTSTDPGQGRTPAELAEKTRLYWEHMQRSNNGNTTPNSNRRADLIAWTEATEAKKTPDTIEWKPSGWTATERARRAEEARKQSRIDNSTPEAIAEAVTNSHRYHLAHIATDPGKVRTMTAEAVADTWSRYTKYQARRTATANARAKARAKAKQTAKTANVDTLSTTYEQWKAWTPEQQKAHLCYLASLARR